MKTTEQITVSAKGLAARLEVSTRQIRRLDSSGKIPAARRIGAAKRWSVSEVEAWISANCPDRATWNAMQKEIGSATK